MGSDYSAYFVPGEIRAVPPPYSYACRAKMCPEASASCDGERCLEAIASAHIAKLQELATPCEIPPLEYSVAA